jgi:PAS domain S-box-containing protein
MLGSESKCKAGRRRHRWRAASVWLASLYASPWWQRSALGVALAVGGAICRANFPGPLGERLAYVTFGPAVAVATLLGGWSSGIPALFVSAVLAHMFFIPLVDTADWLGLAIFLISCGAMSAVAEAVRFEVADRNARLNAVLNATKDAIVTINEAGVIQLMNVAGAKMFGYGREEVVGRSLDMFLPGFFLSPDEVRRGIFRAGDAAEGRRKNGSSFPLEASVAEASQDGDGSPLFVVVLRDLSDQRKAEARIDKLHAERLSSAETMMIALAHELNQPLAATATYLNVIRRLLRSPADARSANIEGTLDQAVAQIKRAGHIIADIRNFMARREPDKTVQSLHKLITEVYRAALLEAKPPLSGTFALDATNDRVLVDETQVRLVLSNLLRNATEAMSGAERRFLRVSTSNERSTIRVDVADTGPGVSEEVKESLFETFATTKTTGMGAALMISKAIIDAHYGNMRLEQNPGGGAVFSFALPLFED